MTIRKFLFILDGNNLQGPLKLWVALTPHEHNTGRFPLLLKLPLLSIVSSYVAAEVLHFVPLCI